MECLACKSISGEKRISPGPFIYEGKYWIIDHAYPTKLLGWLVIVLKEHKEALHELTKEEFRELFILQEKTIKLFFKELNSEKEYVACFSEKKLFKHLHFHIIPKPRNLSDKFQGSKVFALLKENDKNPLSKHQIVDFSENLRRKFVIA